MKMPSAIAVALLAACSSSGPSPGAPPAAEDYPCGRGQEVYITSGLFAWLPIGTTVTGGEITADLVPHAEAGGRFTIDGVDVEIWRASQYGPDDLPSAAGRADHGVAVFVRTDDPRIEHCVLAGLRYDPARDVE